MRELEDRIMTIYLVQLGKLFYAGGLTRTPNNDESFSYEFVRDEEVAFSILFEDIAERIAEKCGGTVVKREMTIREAGVRSDKHDAYINSEGNVVEEFRKQALYESIKQDIKESKKQDKMTEIINESFLLPLIHQGFTEFDYSNGIFYSGVVGESLKKAEIHPEKETILALVQIIAEADNQIFNYNNPLIKVVQHPAVYMTAQLDTFKKDEFNTCILIKEEAFKSSN